MQKKGLISLLTLLLGYLTLIGQTADSKVISFNAQQHNNYIMIDFTIAAGNLCSGVVLEYATDSLNFQPIHTFLGICGSADHNETYTYSHYDIKKNANNYYRLNIGGASYTRFVYTYFREYGSSNYSIYPMPLTRESKLYFKNDSNKRFLFEVINIEGKIIITRYINGINMIELGDLNMKAGSYIFKLGAEDGTTITGDFIIL